MKVQYRVNKGSRTILILNFVKFNHTDTSFFTIHSNFVVLLASPSLKLVWRIKKKIKWKEKVTNELFLGRIEEKRTHLNNIRCRKDNWVAHSRKNLPSSWYHWRTDDGSESRRKKKIATPWWDLRSGRKYWELKEEAEDRKRWKRQFITWAYGRNASSLLQIH